MPSVEMEEGQDVRRVSVEEHEVNAEGMDQVEDVNIEQVTPLVALDPASYQH